MKVGAKREKRRREERIREILSKKPSTGLKEMGGSFKTLRGIKSGR